MSMVAPDRRSLQSKRLARYFSEYSSYHQTRGNKLTHYFGITFIVVSLLGLLGTCVVSTPFLPTSDYFRLDGGVILLTVSALWYLFIDWKIAIPFIWVLLGLYFLGRTLPSSINWALFVSGWILQFIGHLVYEKKSPAFVQNLIHVLIGPIWIFCKLVGYR